MLATIKQSIDDSLEQDHKRSIEKVFDQFIHNLDKKVGIDLLRETCGNDIYEYLEANMASSLARRLSARR